MYTSGPLEGSPPCLLTVSSEGGGFIRVTAAGQYTLFAQPTAFKVLLDGGYEQVPGGSDAIGYNYQIYGTVP